MRTLVGRVSVDQPRSIEHHFWAPNQSNAVLLAKSMYDRGSLVKLISPLELEGGGTIWGVDAEVLHSPRDAARATNAEEFVRLAAGFDSEYDGWGTNI